MAVFAYENGKLVPAQPVDLSMSRLGEGTLTALRERAAELLDVPLFPIAWVGEPVPSGVRESLIALDTTGQIVTVDVLARLSSDELIAALAATGRHADNSTERLATLYAAGAEAFSDDWRAFLDACPPSSRPGPRLFLIVLGIEEELRPAVDALAGAGVDVRVASVIDAGSQVLISLEQVRPRITALSRVLGVARRRVQVGSGTRSAGWETNFVGTAEGDAAVEVAHVGGFGPGYVDAEASECDDDVAPTSTSSSEEAPLRSRRHGMHAKSRQVESESTPSTSGRETVEIHATESHEPAGRPRPSARHAAKRVGGLHSARFSNPPVVPDESTPDILPVVPAEQPHDFGERLKDMLAADTSSEQAPAVDYQPPAAEPPAPPADEAEEAEEPTPPAPDASVQTLSTFDIASRPPVPAPSQVEPEVPMTRAPASAVTVDSPGSALSAATPSTSRRFKHTKAEAGGAREALPAYEQSRVAQLRAEQVLWESAAPARESSREKAPLISESAAASFSSDAVEDAAERDYLSPAGRLMAIAKRNETPVNLTWVSPRRGIDLRAQVTPWGTLVLSNGAAYSDPTVAAREQSGIDDVDGWKVWKATDGRRLGEL